MSKIGKKGIRMRHCGMDPGKTNFAIVVIESNRVIAAGMLKNTIKSMARHKEHQRDLFCQSIRRFFNTHYPQVIIIEQFAPRRFGTQLTEIVNLMIGGILMLANLHLVTTNLVMASTWKRALNNIGNLDALYRQAKNLGLENHIVDALCLAVYSANGLVFNKKSIGTIRANLPKCKKFLQQNSPRHVHQKRPRKARHALSSRKP